MWQKRAKDLVSPPPVMLRTAVVSFGPKHLVPAFSLHGLSDTANAFGCEKRTDPLTSRRDL
jgi:hypothetical protein